MATEEEQDGVGFSNVGAAARRAVQRAAARSTGSTAGRRTSGASTLSEADRQFLTGGGGTGTGPRLLPILPRWLSQCRDPAGTHL